MEDRPVVVEADADPRGDATLRDVVEAARRCVGRGPVAALALAADLAGRAEVPQPGGGRTLRLWEVLASLGVVDLEVARAVEPHLDAAAIHHEAGLALPAGTTWGVFAAEGAGRRLKAREVDGTWSFHGTKPWCSLAADLTHALVTAWVDDEHRGLFAVDLTGPDVDRNPGLWAARGLPGVTSTPVTFDAVPVTPVGGPGWYLERDGFAWGGIGVAAVWYGGAVAVARRLHDASLAREPDQLALVALGAADTALVTARSALAGAAAAVDAGRAAGAAGAVLALRTRQVVVDAAETVLRLADHGLGPGPLVSEPDHAARVADLHLYLRQHHGERDLAALGREVLRDRPW